MAADGTVTIKAILDSSGVKKGVSEIDSSVGGIGTEGVDKLGSSSKKTGDEMEGAGKKTGTAASTMKSAGGAMAIAGAGLTAGVTVPVIAMGKGAFDSAASFQTSMNMVRQATGASEEDMASLSAYAKQMGADTIYSAGEAGDAMLELAKSGMTPAQIRGGALATSMDLAAAGNLGLADAANITVQAMSMFGIPAEDSAQAANALAGAANASTADVSDLAQGLSQCGTVAANAGWSIQDTTGALAMFADAGINSSDAGTSLKTMLLSLEAPSDKAAECMAQYGVSLYNADGSMKNTSAMAQNLQDGLGGLAAEQQNAALVTMFGSDATRVAALMMENGAEGVDKYTSACNDQGAAADMANARNSGWAGTMEKMSGAIDTVVMTLGEKLAPIITQVADFIGGLCDAFMGLDPNMQNVILVVVAIVAAIGPLLLIIGSIVLILPTLAAGFALIFSPIGLVIAAIAALVAMFVYLWNTNEGFRLAVTTAWDSIVAKVNEVVAYLLPYLEQAWASIQNAVQVAMAIIVPIVTAAFNFIMNTVVPVLGIILSTVGEVFGSILATISGVMDGVSQIISGVWNVIQGIFQVVCGLINGIVTGDFSQMQAGIESIMNGISSIIEGVWNTIVSIIGGVVNSITSIIEGGFNAISEIAAGIFNGIKDAIDGAMGGAKNVVSDACGAISNFFSGMKLELPRISLPHFTLSGDFNLDPLNFSIPNIGIDWYAKGGVFNGASVIGVGEAGPEAVVPLLGRRMQPFAQAVAAGINGDTRGTIPNITITIEQFNNYDTERDTDEIIRIITKKIKDKTHGRGRG